MKLMFVCTANTCRSAMAEVIFKEFNREDIEVYSAGLNATTGKSASKNTQDVCSLHGFDASKHTATNIRDSNIEEMDLVLTATDYHKNKLKINYPNLNIYTIKEYIEEFPRDIDDPYGSTIEDYDKCFNEILEALEKLNLYI